MNSSFAGIALAGVLALTGCVQADGEVPTRTSTQALTGNIPDDADLERPEVVAVDEAGDSHRAEPDANGDFELELPSGHSYELYVSEEGARGLDQANQVVFPRVDGRVDGGFTVASATAPFDLGEVRPAGTLETAEYRVSDTAAADALDDADDADALDDADENGDVAERTECSDGPPGLFCVHDGEHPACNGLSIAAVHRGDAHESAAEPEQSRPVALPQFNPPFEFSECGAE